VVNPVLNEPDLWCERTFPERRAMLAEALRQQLGDIDAVNEVMIEAGTVGREYDLNAAVGTDVGWLRTALWSHARAMIFCDGSIHEANRRQLAPAIAVREAADRLRRRLGARFELESRGLTVRYAVEPAVERIWSAERSRFRNRTAVVREDRVENEPEGGDLRDLLARFYSGPSLRVEGADGTVFLLPEATDVEGPLVTLCHACGHWEAGAHPSCPSCGGATDVVVAARPPRR
jgi:hypothetical protein